MKFLTFLFFIAGVGNSILMVNTLPIGINLIALVPAFFVGYYSAGMDEVLK